MGILVSSWTQKPGAQGGFGAGDRDLGVISAMAGLGVMRLHRMVEGDSADRGEQRAEQRELGTATFRSQEAEELAKGDEKERSGRWKGNQERADIEVWKRGIRERAVVTAQQGATHKGQARRQFGNGSPSSIEVVSTSFRTRCT